MDATAGETDRMADTGATGGLGAVTALKSQFSALRAGRWRTLIVKIVSPPDRRVS